MRPEIKPRIIGIDFDGTVVLHDYPRVGERALGAVYVLQELVHAGHQLILITMRSHSNGTLQPAIDWFAEHTVPLLAVNDNPTQASWSDSRKIFVHLSIDDANLGVPLITPATGRPYVDWAAVDLWLRRNGWLRWAPREESP